MDAKVPTDRETGRPRGFAFVEFSAEKDAQEAIAGLKHIGDLCREREVDTIVISDTHWLVNAGYHINARPQMKGVFSSTEGS